MISTTNIKYLRMWWK